MLFFNWRHSCKPLKTPFLPIITWLPWIRIHHSKLSPCETGTGLTCSPVPPGNGGGHTCSLLEYHVQDCVFPSLGLRKTPVQVRQGGPGHLQRWSGGSPASYSLSLSVLEQPPPRVSQTQQPHKLAAMQEHSSSWVTSLPQPSRALDGVDGEAGTSFLQALVLLFFETIKLATPLGAGHKKHLP